MANTNTLIRVDLSALKLEGLQSILVGLCAVVGSNPPTKQKNKASAIAIITALATDNNVSIQHDGFYDADGTKLTPKPATTTPATDQGNTPTPTTDTNTAPATATEKTADDQIGYWQQTDDGAVFHPVTYHKRYAKLATEQMEQATKAGMTEDEVRLLTTEQLIGYDMEPNTPEAKEPGNREVAETILAILSGVTAPTAKGRAPRPTTGGERLEGTITVTSNPTAIKGLPKSGSNRAARWALFSTGQTVTAFHKACREEGLGSGSSALRRAAALGYITITATDGTDVTADAATASDDTDTAE